MKVSIVSHLCLIWVKKYTFRTSNITDHRNQIKTKKWSFYRISETLNACTRAIYLFSIPIFEGSSEGVELEHYKLCYQVYRKWRFLKPLNSYLRVFFIVSPTNNGPQGTGTRKLQNYIFNIKLEEY